MTKHALLLLLAALAANGSDLDQRVDPQLPGLVATYKDLHQHPELSHFEEHTSAFLAAELRGGTLEQSVKAGIEAGAVAVGKIGGQPTWR